MKTLLLFIAAILSVAPGCATAAGPVGGQFEMFDVAIEGNRIVGTYLEEQGTGPVRTCAFRFVGTLGPDGRAAVRVHGPGGRPAAGMLRLRGDEFMLSVPQVNSFGGCSVPEGEALTGSRTLTAAWIDLARVTAPRARFALRRPESQARAMSCGVIRSGCFVAMVGRFWWTMLPAKDGPCRGGSATRMCDPWSRSRG